MTEKTGEVLYITPPDLFLPERGLRFYYLGGSDEWKQRVISLAENIYQKINLSHYYSPNPLTDKDIPWAQANIGHADIVFVNFDLINPIEVAFACSRSDYTNTWLYSEEEKNTAILTVMNTVGKCPIFRDMDLVEYALRVEMDNE